MARIHGFPDWFRLHATKWHGARQVGNAVPSPLARAVASAIVDALGVVPEPTEETFALGDRSFLRFSVGKAAAHLGVPAPVRRRCPSKYRGRQPTQGFGESEMFRSMLEREADHRYRIRTLHEITPAMVESLRDFLSLYRLVDMGEPQRTMFQTHINDFPDVQHGEVWILDFTLRMPMVPDLLRRDIASLWNMTGSDIVVRQDYEARAVVQDEAEQMQRENEEAEERGWKSAHLQVDEKAIGAEGPSGEEWFSNAANERLKNDLAAAAAEGRGRDARYPYDDLFDWKRSVPPRFFAYDDDFNASIEDAPKVVPADRADPDKVGIDAPEISRYGNFWREPLRVRPWRDAEGRKHWTARRPATGEMWIEDEPKTR